MKRIFYTLLLCTTFVTTLHAQPPAQATLNKELHAVMVAYPTRFESIRGKVIDSDYGITDYACNVQITGAKETHLWQDEENDSPKLNFHCTIASGLPLNDAKKLYKQWQTLLVAAQLDGAPLKMISEKEEAKYIDFESVFSWKNAATVPRMYWSFRPRLLMNRDRGETFKIVLNIYS